MASYTAPAPLARTAPAPLSGRTSPGFANAVSQDAPTGSLPASIWSTVGPYLAEQDALARQGQHGLENQIGLALAQQQTQSGYINQGSGLERQMLGLQGEDQAIQRAALGRQDPLLNAQQGLSNQGFDLSSLMSWQGAQRGQRRLISDATARGAVQTQGTREGFEEIQQDLQNSLTGIGIERTGSDLSYSERHAQVSDQRKTLDVAAKRLGVSAKEITNKTQQALEALNLSTRLSVDQLFGEIAKLQNGENSALLPILIQIQQATGLNLIGAN